MDNKEQVEILEEIRKYIELGTITISNFNHTQFETISNFNHPILYQAMSELIDITIKKLERVKEG